MGWLFTCGSTRKDLIAERAANLGANRRGRHAGQVHLSRPLLSWWPIQRRVVGSVGEDFHQGWSNRPADRTLDHLRPVAIPENYGWGYKDMDESDAPLFLLLPLGLLEMVPIDQFGGNTEWREGVRKYHAQQAEKRRQRCPA